MMLWSIITGRKSWLIILSSPTIGWIGPYVLFRFINAAGMKLTFCEALATRLRVAIKGYPVHQGRRCKSSARVGPVGCAPGNPGHAAGALGDRDESAGHPGLVGALGMGLSVNSATGSAMLLRLQF